MSSNIIASAGECRDRFMEITSDTTPKGPVKMSVTSNFNDTFIMKSNYFEFELDHWMNEGLEPKGMPFTLAYNHAMYNSYDKGKTWKKVDGLDAEKARRESVILLVDELKSTNNAVCGEEEIDGVIYDWVEADYSSLQFENTKYYKKYWIERKTGWLAKIRNKIITKNDTNLVIRIIEKAPDLTLPKPN